MPLNHPPRSDPSTAIVSAAKLVDAVVDDRYVLEAVLRQRSVSWSFKARDPRQRRSVVVRLFRPAHPNSSDFRDAREALLGLGAKGLAKYIYISASGTDLHSAELMVPDVHYAVRIFDGRTLSSQVHDREAMVANHRTILGGVLTGLIQLHDHNIAHGDLRPGNVIISDDYIARLADFGLPLLGFQSDTVAELHTSEQQGSHALADLPQSYDDIYTFGLLIREILDQNMRDSSFWSHRNSPRATWESVAALCTREDPLLRPTAQALYDVIFSKARGTARAVHDWLGDPRTLRIAWKNLSRRSAGVAHRYHMKDLESERHRLAVNIQSMPEILLFFTAREVVAHYLATCVLVGDSTRAYNVLSNTMNAEDKPQTAAYESLQPPDIDGDWIERIRLHYHAEEPSPEVLAKYPLMPAMDRRAMFPTHSELLSRALNEVKAASEIRAQILREEHLIYTDDVVELMASTVPEISLTDVIALTRSGRLLAIRDHGRTLYPTFQFEVSLGYPLPIIEEVNTLLHGEEAGWSVLHWWRRGHPILKGRSPKESLLEQGSNAVSDIRAAALVSADLVA